MANITTNSDTVVAVWDYDVDGAVDTDGNIFTYANIDAIHNALMTWVETELGEVLNNPLLGGSLYAQHFKSFSLFQRLKILFMLRSQIDNFFFPKIQIIHLDIEPDYTVREWVIVFSYVIDGYAEEKTARIVLRKLNIKPLITPEIEIVEYTGQTLLNYVRIYLYDMQNKSLREGEVDGVRYFFWGNSYRFDNLVESDPYFEQITNVINSNRT